MTGTILLAMTAIAAVASLSAPSVTSGDRAFVAKVSQGGMFEVEAGKLAATKASTQDVRDFAIAEVHDHVLVGKKLKAISAAEGIVIGATLNADFTAKLARLDRLSGSRFDQAYLAEMASLHDADGAAFAKEANAGGSAAFRSFGAETHRIVERHIGAIHADPKN